MSEGRTPPRRPALVDPELMQNLRAELGSEQREELAQRSAASLVYQDQSETDERVLQRLIDVAEDEGISVFAELWQPFPITTLPGALWAVYDLQDLSQQLLDAGVDISPTLPNLIQLADAIFTGKKADEFPQALLGIAKVSSELLARSEQLISAEILTESQLGKLKNQTKGLVEAAKLAANEKLD